MNKVYIWWENGDEYLTLHSPKSAEKLSAYAVPDEVVDPITLEKAIDDRGMLPIGDFVNIGGSQPKLLSQDAYQLLKPYLEKSGQVKPAILEPEGEEYFVFYLENTLDCLDLERSDILTMASGYQQLKKPVISKDKLGDNHIFSVKEFSKTDVYISEDVYKIIKESDLQGGIFQKVDII